MQGRVEKRNTPISGVKCVVNTCHYYTEGDRCSARQNRNTTQKCQKHPGNRLCYICCKIKSVQSIKNGRIFFGYAHFLYYCSISDYLSRKSV